MKKIPKTLVVIGRGPSSLGFLEALANHSQRHKVQKIYWVAPSLASVDEGMPHGALLSTATIALQGIRTGVSPLGDELVAAFGQMKSFLNEKKREGFSGIVSCRRFHIPCDEEDEESLQKRFLDISWGQWRGRKVLSEEAFFLHPMEFISSWEESLLKRLPALENCDDRVKGWNDIVVKGELRDYPYEQFFSGMGAGEIYSFSLPERRQKLKRVPGHYLKGFVTDENWGHESFIATYRGHNLLYDPRRHSFTFGGTTEKDGLLAARKDHLYRSLRSTLENLGLSLNLEKVQLETGVRVKGKKRRPLLSHWNEKGILLNGLYKNGYTLGILYGHKALSELIFP